MLTIDRQLFEWINRVGTHPLLDHVLPFMRNGENWIPLYIILFGIAIYKLRVYSIYWVIALLITISLTDGIGNYGFKKNVERPRPCHEASQVEARLLVTCGSGYSFTSNHAANHMGMAVFISFTLFSGSGWAMALFLLWAFIIGYAQVYVGVHYPFDILGGFALGILCSLIGIRLYHWAIRKFPFSVKLKRSDHT